MLNLEEQLSILCEDDPNDTTPSSRTWVIRPEDTFQIEPSVGDLIIYKEKTNIRRGLCIPSKGRGCCVGGYGERCVLAIPFKDGPCEKVACSIWSRKDRRKVVFQNLDE